MTGSDPAVTATLDVALDDLARARNYNAWLFDRVRPYLGARVLDAGAGIGTFVELAAAAGSDVTALEPDPVFAARLRARLPGTTVVEVPAESLPPALGGFDTVVCLNVLEHVERDADALERFRDALLPGGRLLLLVPAHPHLYGYYDRAAGHVRRYSKGSLRRLLEGSGFAVETLRHVNPVGALGWLAGVRLRRRDAWPSSEFRTFDRLVPLLRPLDALRLPFGLSLWAVATVGRDRGR